MAERSGLSSNLFMNPEQARNHYNLTQEELGLFASDLEKDLYANSIAQIEMPVSAEDFTAMLGMYEVCIVECPDELAATAHSVDDRFGNNAGQVRKERKLNKQGQQIQDPKNLFHFNEFARRRWAEQFVNPPSPMADFLEAGYDIHSDLIKVAQAQFAELESTHPNISKAYFLGTSLTAEQIVSHSYMRPIIYDSYEPVEGMGDVAKAHWDIGGATIQAFANAPGFWGSPDGPNGERVFYDTQTGRAYMFMGKGHGHLYGEDAMPRPLYHGVERVVPEGATWVPKRHAVILFIDAPFINYGTKPEDTLPYISTETSEYVS